jgi:hypothetical protein
LDTHRRYIGADEDARVRHGPDERDGFATRKADGAAEHHVGRCCEEERADEEEGALGYEGGPRGVVVVRADAGCEAGHFTCVGWLDGWLSGVG